ncbi:MAG: adenosylmethionine decarboxylase [Pseudomonadota bacterium]
MTYIAPGLHLLIDLWDCSHLQDIAHIEQTMRHAAATCGATVLDVTLHSFGENAGVTGVAILSESHISIHTWPETGYVAIDVFMCGSCNPHQSVPIFQAAFAAGRTDVVAHARGNRA